MFSLVSLNLHISSVLMHYKEELKHPQMNTQKAGIPSGWGAHRAPVCQRERVTVRAVCPAKPHTAGTASSSHSSSHLGTVTAATAPSGLLAALPKALIPPASLVQCLTRVRRAPGREQGLEGCSGSVPSAPGCSAALISSRALKGAAIKVNVWHHTAGRAAVRRLQGDSNADTEPVPRTKANSSSTVAKATGCW